jgi:pilus assembly protein CpaD
MTKKTFAIRALLLASCMLALQACGTPRAPEDRAQVMTTPLDAHPIKVESRTERLELRAPTDAFALSAEDRRALDLFALAYEEVGHGPIVVSLPTGGENAQAAVQVATDARGRLFQSGVAWDKIAGGAYDATQRRDAPVVLTFIRYTAEAPKCRPMSDYDMTDTANNLAIGRFGCAQSANLAAMVADPADLKGPRPMTPSDAGRRDVVLGKYRTGEPTGAQRSEDERGDVRSSVQ